MMEFKLEIKRVIRRYVVRRKKSAEHELEASKWRREEKREPNR